MLSIIKKVGVVLAAVATVIVAVTDVVDVFEK